MPGYLTQQHSVSIAGAADLLIRSLLDRQQYADPLGLAAGLGISSATWPLFGLLWPSGAELAAQMALRVLVADERILEVGCGLGLSSLVMHRRGADITASDQHPLAGEFLAANVLLNGMLPLKYRQGAWDRGAADPATDRQDRAQDRTQDRVGERYGLIIGSDVLYDRDASAALVGFIHRHALPASEVLIVDPDRGNRAAFNRGMATLGFARVESRLDRAAAGLVPAYKGRLLSFARA